MTRQRSLIEKLLSSHNWRGFAGMLDTAVDRLDVFTRYYLRHGSFPYTVRLRTPIGMIALELHSREDFVTVHEVFFRRDYRLSRGEARRLRIAVDFGTNIGVTTAYFLTRNPEVRVYCYEPVPTNVARAYRNLAPFVARVVFSECAVSTGEGTASFGVESSGRYGGLGVPHPDRINVECRRGEAELDRVLQRHDRIDVLKLDVEGMEVPIIKSLTKPELDAIDCIVAECDGREVSVPRFSYSQYLDVARFTAARA